MSFHRVSAIFATDPRLPPALPSTFQVTVEATFSTLGSSMSATEYVDQASGRSAMLILQDGNLESLYANINTNETYHVMGEFAVVRVAFCNEQNATLNMSL